MRFDTLEKHASGIRGGMLLVMGMVLSTACGGELPAREEGPGEAPGSSVVSSHESTRPQGLGSTNKVLILASSVTTPLGGKSVERAVAESLGYTVELATDTAWAAKTSADFATYRAIILGDASCARSLSLVQAAVNNRRVWGSVVDGNVIVVGTDPVVHKQTQLTKNAIQFATARQGRTGAYINLSCYYHDAAANTPVPLLEPFGSFSVTGVGIWNDIHIVAQHPALVGLTDTNLSNWKNSVHEAFDTYPEANFTPLAIARDPLDHRFPGSRDFADGSHGVPYIVVRGATPVSCGNGGVEFPEECDTGTSNGVAGTACSSVCRLHWCGDGAVDPGEECDTGASNGTGACTASCRSLGPTPRAPVARCKDLRLETVEFCGAPGSVDDGSYDPDGNLHGCQQTPEAPFNVGETQVTLTCVDTTNLRSSCTATVRVTTAPRISCPSDALAECSEGGAFADPGTAMGSSICGPPDVFRGHAAGRFPLGSTPVTHGAVDRFGNTTTCTNTVTVVDTQAPTVVLEGPSPVTVECHSPYVEAGVVAHDSCEGDLSSRVSISGSVDTEVPGTYTLTYSVADAVGSVGSTRRTVTVVPGPACGAPTERNWALTSNLALQRLLHTATKLADGRVLVAGGFNVTSEIYDPGTKSWSSTGDTLTTHRGHTATELRDGRVLVAGGGQSYFTGLTAELYVPEQGRWQSAGRLNQLRFNHTAALLPDGKVLVAGGGSEEYGGVVLSSAELYDPDLGTWSFTHGLNTARRFHTMTSLPGGKVLVTGGTDASGALVSSAELYDPATGQWTTVAGMSTGRTWHAAVLLKDGRVLVTGGVGIDVTLSASAEVYDPATNTWSATGGMGTPRRYHSATVLNDGRVLVSGGYHELTGILYASELYDPATGEWSATGPMHVDRYHHTATLLNDGTVLVAGGVSNHDQSSAEVY